MSKLPIPKGYENSVCEIKSMDNMLIAIGRIKEITAKYIKIGNDKKELLLVDYGTPIKINVFNAKIGFRVLVGSIYTSTPMEMTIESIYNLVEKERRSFFRVDMHTDAKIFYSRDLDDDQPLEISATILDLSLSGLKFRTPHEFEVNDTFAIELDLSEKRKSIFQSKILRLIDIKKKLFYYGCEFVYSKSEDADLLCSYLFKKQREFLSHRDGI